MITTNDEWKAPDPQGKPRRIAVDERGYRVGESHHNCKYSDELVNHIRDLAEYKKLTCRVIADNLGVNIYSVRAIVGYRRRASIPRRYRHG